MNSQHIIAHLQVEISNIGHDIFFAEAEGQLDRLGELKVRLVEKQHELAEAKGDIPNNRCTRCSSIRTKVAQ